MKKQTTKRSTRKITKPQTTAPAPAAPSVDALTTFQASRLIKAAGFDVREIASDMFRVHVPDPADGYHVRSYFDATRLREIAVMDREGLAGAISSAPIKSTSPYFKEPNMTDTTNNGKSTKGTGLPETSITDAKVEEYIRKAAAAGVKQTPSAICRFIRAAGDGLSEKRCGRILGAMKDKPKVATSEKTEVTEKAKPEGNGKGATKKAATKTATTKSGAKKKGALLNPKEKKAGAAATK